MMTVFLAVIALASAIITICAKTFKNNSLQYVFKPLTMAAIILTAALNVSAPPLFYQTMIITGLIISTVGDVFLVDSKRFVQGLSSFLLAHICFAAAFSSPPNFPALPFYLLYAALAFFILRKNLGKLKIPVFVYTLAVTTMSWLALSRYLELNDDKTLLAFVGTIFFVVSDSLLAFNKFKSSFSFAEIFILSTYFIAQWLIALSV